MRKFTLPLFCFLCSGELFSSSSTRDDRLVLVERRLDVLSLDGLI